jgi:hypothetical protein
MAAITRRLARNSRYGPLPPGNSGLPPILIWGITRPRAGPLDLTPCEAVGWVTELQEPITPR